MDYVSLVLALSGDQGNTVPKTVPVSEVPILQLLHGEDAISEVELVDPPADAEDLDNREEIARLLSIYGGNDESVVNVVYPGRGAQVITSIGDLGLPEEVFKATERAVPQTKAKAKSRGAKKADTEKADDNGDNSVME